MTLYDLDLIEANTNLVLGIFGNIEDKTSNETGKDLSKTLSMTKCAIEAKKPILNFMMMDLPDTKGSKLLKGSVEHNDETAHIALCDIEAYEDRSSYTYGDIGNMVQLLKESTFILRSYDDLITRAMNFKASEIGNKKRKEWINKIFEQNSDGQQDFM